MIIFKSYLQLLEMELILLKFGTEKSWGKMKLYETIRESFSTQIES